MTWPDLFASAAVKAFPVSVISPASCWSAKEASCGEAIDLVDFRGQGVAAGTNSANHESAICIAGRGDDTILQVQEHSRNIARVLPVFSVPSFGKDRLRPP